MAACLWAALCRPWQDGMLSMKGADSEPFLVRLNCQPAPWQPCAGVSCGIRLMQSLANLQTS